MAQDVTQAKAAAAAAPGRMQVLLIEDDDGDALLVQELLLEAQAAVTLHRARSLAEARPLLPGATCVLLDLGLPTPGNCKACAGCRSTCRRSPSSC